MKDDPPALCLTLEEAGSEPGRSELINDPLVAGAGLIGALGKLTMIASPDSELALTGRLPAGLPRILKLELYKVNLFTVSRLLELWC